jgi:hypothetical protein
MYFDPDGKWIDIACLSFAPFITITAFKGFGFSAKSTIIITSTGKDVTTT